MSDALTLDELNDLMGCDEEGDTTDLLRAAAAQAESSRLLNEDEINGLIDDSDDHNSIDLSRIKSDYLSLNEDDAYNPSSSQKNKEVDQPANLFNGMDGQPSLHADAFNHLLHKPFQPSAMPVGMFALYIYGWLINFSVFVLIAIFL